VTTAAESGTIPWSLQPLPSIQAQQVMGVSLGPDGDRFMIRGRSAISMFDEDGRRLWQAEGTSGPDIGWSQDGSRVLVAMDGQVRVLESETGQRQKPAAVLRNLAGVNALALSPDDVRIAVGASGVAGPDDALFILDLSAERSVRLRGVVDPVVGLVWTSAAAIAVVTARTVQLWNADRSVLIRSVAIDGNRICALAYAPAASVIAVAEQGGVRILEMQNNDRPTWVPMVAPTDLAFTRSQAFLLVGSAARVRVMALDGTTVATIPAAITARGQIAVSRSGLIAVRQNGTTVSVYEPTDLEPRVRRKRTLPRRWAMAMGRTVGRAPGPRPFRDPPEVRDIVLAGTVPGTRAPGFAWSPRGSWFAEINAGRLARFDGDMNTPVWECSLEAGRPVYEVAVSADGSRLAAAARNDIGQVALVDVADGSVVFFLVGGQAPAFAPSGQPYLAVPEPGSDPRGIRVYDVTNGRLVITRSVDGGIGRIAWSPDGKLLAAAAGRGRIVIWRTSDWNRVQHPAVVGSPVLISRIAWSPDGRYLAATPAAGSGPTVVLETETWQPHQNLGPPGGRDWAPALCWSPDSRLLLFPMPSPDAATVGVWDVGEGVLLRSLRPPDPTSPTAQAWTTAWSPDGQTIAVSYTDGRVVHFLLSGGPVSPGKPARLPYPVSLLARLGGVCGEVGARIPLSLEAGLLALTGDDPVPELAPLAAHRAVRALRGLRWPAAARIGIVALLAAELVGEESYAPPPGHGQEELTSALGRVLAATPTPRSAPAVPFAELATVLGTIDDAVLSLLSILGPDAVQADPGLPARLRGTIRDMSPLAPKQRRLLDLRLFMADGGMADGRATGGSRSGLSRHGDVNRLLPSQLALEDDVFRLRQVRDELLFRTRQGRLPPGPQAMILILDDTPPAHGAVGVTLRTCAHLLAATMIRWSRSCVLVRLGDPREPLPLSRHPDLIRLWTECSLASPDMEGTMTAVQMLVPALTTDSAGAPRVLLLTHPYLAAPPLLGLRVLRVHYPGRPVSVPDGYLLAPDPDSGALRNVLASALSDAD
jgi:WD40 repeat protein